MIAQKHRFHGLGSLRFVYQNGKTVRANALSVKFVRNQRRQTYRCAVVVSKKVNKSAVARNRIRRRVYEVVRGFGDRIDGPYDVAISIFSDEVRTMPAEQLKKTLQGLFEQADMLS